MIQNDTLLLNVARNLRYRTLEQFIGEAVTIDDRMQIVPTVSSFVAQFVDDCTFAGPQQRFLDGQVAKYDLLDLNFNAPATMLDADSRTGLPLLRELGFIDGDMQTLSEELDGVSTGCLEELRDDITENKTHLLLFLESSDPNVPDMSMINRMSRIRDPSIIDFPIEFTVVDACVSNSSIVWLNKYFYM